MGEIKQLVIIGPVRVLESLQSLVLAIWESDHKYERLDELTGEIKEITKNEKER